jgi:hypothetical protein
MQLQSKSNKGNERISCRRCLRMTIRNAAETTHSSSRSRSHERVKSAFRPCGKCAYKPALSSVNVNLRLTAGLIVCYSNISLALESVKKQRQTGAANSGAAGRQSVGFSDGGTQGFTFLAIHDSGSL